ncbi:MAG: response regulator [Armatimonadota bacterium]|nr:response regulator [Armatimonadota bacterium]MDR7463393.1 response regulator [Armatimonadota bacterium]MDR7468552.1 response regulator [Armatimonadota bacterium]MDR7475145.1 response regulator [Armatimonadota bacterium]MDR7539644.1 response regulator [Armatimonadota bacterium]
MTRRIRLLLVDDHALFRKGIARLLASRADMEVVGEAADGEEAMAQALATKPDVVVMDIYISTDTVRNHIRSVLEKLNLRNRLEAAAYAARIGLIDAGHPGENRGVR